MCVRVYVCVYVLKEKKSDRAHEVTVFLTTIPGGAASLVGNLYFCGKPPPI